MVPFCKILIDEIDLTNFVSGLSYEDCINEDDLLKFSIHSPKKEFLEKNLLKVGKEIKFQYGYFGALVSPLRLAIIKDIEYNYEKTTTISITALDIGNNMKKGQEQKVWQNKTASQIATEIAKKYGFKTDKIETTNYFYNNLPQGNKTDFELLDYLAQREKNGSFRFFIKDNYLIFNRLALEKETGIKFTFGENIISFKPSLKDSQKDGTSAGVGGMAFDPLTKQTQSFGANPTTSKDNFALGSNVNSANDTKNTPTQLKYDAYGKLKK
jgi:phage protein D